MTEIRLLNKCFLLSAVDLAEEIDGSYGETRLQIRRGDEMKQAGKDIEFITPVICTRESLLQSIIGQANLDQRFAVASLCSRLV